MKRRSGSASSASTWKRTPASSCTIFLPSGAPTAMWTSTARGFPLIEIVSAPEMRTPEEAAAYLRKLRAILMFLDICDGNMEEGSFRCDANISLRPKGQKTLGVKTELKNMNSFRNVQRALDYEIRRQTALLDQGERIIQETRLWDAARGVTSSMRGKEEAHDYRYFPDPDLVPIVVDPEWVAAIQAGLPELPDTEKGTLHPGIRDPGVRCRGSDLLQTPGELLRGLPAGLCQTQNRQQLDHVRAPAGTQAGRAGNRRMPGPGARILAQMLKLIDEGLISGKIAKSVFEEMYRTGKKAEEIVKEKGWVQVTDTSAIEKTIEEILAKNPKEVEEYKKGKEKLFGFFVGPGDESDPGQSQPAAGQRTSEEKVDGFVKSPSAALRGNFVVAAPDSGASLLSFCAPSHCRASGARPIMGVRPTPLQSKPSFR